MDWKFMLNVTVVITNITNTRYWDCTVLDILFKTFNPLFKHTKVTTWLMWQGQFQASC